MASKTTLTTPGKTEALSGAHRILVVYSPGNAHTGVTVPFAGGSVMVGRMGGDADLAFDDPEISRAHASIEEGGSDEGFRVRDAGSRNGTYLNGIKIGESPLVDGDVLRIGSHILLFQYVDFSDADAAVGAADDQRIVGSSFVMARVRRLIQRYGDLTEPVLVLGESGVGKELVARALHEHSGRSGAFVPVNCAALPENLIESELFGHTEGAFTGASRASRGLFGEAEGGTLFLDELGEMPTHVQAKLLRAIETGAVRPVGDTHERELDVRIVAATNVDLKSAVETESFRGDLFARLMGRTVEVPPLRARRDDVLRLVDHFAARQGGRVTVTPEAAEALLVHGWPYNVRELEQTVRSFDADTFDRRVLELSALPEHVREVVDTRTARRPPLPEEIPIALRVRREGTPSAVDLTEVLRHFDGSIARAAEFFGKDRKQIYRWAERLAVDLEAFRDEDSTAG